MLEGSTQGKMGVGTTQGKTNYPLRESYATQVCRKTKRGPLARAHIELWRLKLLQLVGLQLATPHPEIEILTHPPHPKFASMRLVNDY